MLSTQSHAQLDKEFKSIGYTDNDTLWIDSTSLYRHGFELIVNGVTIDTSKYTLNATRGFLTLTDIAFKRTDTIRISYFPQAINYNQAFKHKSDTLIFNDIDSTLKPSLFSIDSYTEEFDFFSESQLNKQGSISRGVSVGNAQNLSFQSTLNLQLNGKIGPDLFIKGSISDDNIPFQPDGNTQKLQEFDQVFLQIYNDDFSVTGGDFWLRKPEGYFLNYQKRSQGLSLDYKHGMPNAKSNPVVSHKLSGAFSRGKFARNIVQGIEGSQGPYRLFGADNEQNIIILAGTENVYIDGVLMKRGQAFDYTIDYNGAEITFTANQFITKDKRIIIEFQYSDLNYARSLVAYNGDFKGDKYRSWVNVYSEQDAKNQTIQQNLTPEKKLILSEAGDSLLDAFSNSIDSIGYFENRVLYSLIDSVVDGSTYDSVLFFTPTPDSAVYQAFFSQVEMGQGDYVFDRFTANGRVYRWVAPIEGEKQGDYAPVQLLIAPQKKQMFVFGTDYTFTENINSSIEIALSNQDQNTFSDLDAGDNQGVAVKWKWNSMRQLGAKEKWKLNTNANFEYNEKTFRQIQWFRSVEFDRDWNVRNQAYQGHQYLSNASLRLVGKDLGSIGYNFENFIWGEDYTGFRNTAKVTLNKKGWSVLGDASYLVSQGIEETSFLRHNLDLSKSFKKLKIGFIDIQETNQKKLKGNDVLQLNSYRFYDWKTYIGTVDSSKNELMLYYRERYDWFSDSTADMDIPTGGISGSASLLNVTDGLEFSFNAVALDDFWQGSIAHTEPGSLIPNLSSAVPESKILLNNSIQTSTWNTGIEAVSAVLMYTEIYNEYAFDAAAVGKSEWVVTFPTKFLHTVNVSSAMPPFDQTWNGEQACEEFSILVFDRESQIDPPGNTQITPQPPAGANPSMCYHTNVIEFISGGLPPATTSSIFGADNLLTVEGVDSAIATENGWAAVAFYSLSQNMTPISGSGYMGLPAVGFQVQQLTNNSAQPGLIAQYGRLFEHKGVSFNF